VGSCRAELERLAFVSVLTVVDNQADLKPSRGGFVRWSEHHGNDDMRSELEAA